MKVAHDSRVILKVPCGVYCYITATEKHVLRSPGLGHASCTCLQFHQKEYRLVDTKSLTMYQDAFRCVFIHSIWELTFSLQTHVTPANTSSHKHDTNLQSIKCRGLFLKHLQGYFMFAMKQEVGLLAS